MGMFMDNRVFSDSLTPINIKKIILKQLRKSNNKNYKELIM
jgi:hypothetical protein